MSRPIDVAVFVGSLRKASLNRRMAHALRPLCPPELKLDPVALRDLPLYDEDLEAEVPAPWRTFRERVARAHALLFVTPEYNRSMPGALKNALDVGSRPYGKSVWGGKPAAIVSVSPGSIGGFGANHHLRQSLVYLDVPVMQQPEAYIGNASSLFDEHDQITNESTRDFMTQFMRSFSGWAQRFLR